MQTYGTISIEKSRNMFNVLISIVSREEKKNECLTFPVFLNQFGGEVVPVLLRVRYISRRRKMLKNYLSSLTISISRCSFVRRSFVFVDTRLLLFFHGVSHLCDGVPDAKRNVIIYTRIYE